MKTLRTLIALFLIFGIGGLFVQCQHDDMDIAPPVGPDPIVHGTEKISCTDCTPLVSNGASADFSSAGVPAGTWYFDKSHSSTLWESPYKGAGSLLTGRFNYFVVQTLTFDDAKPGDLAFEGYVRLNTVNTGEPGRDGGCLLGTFLTDAAFTTEAANIATIKTIPGTGRYSTTDGGFIVDANFTFLGITKQLPVKLYYFPQTDQGTYTMAAVNAEFEFLANTDFFAVASKLNSNISDKVKISVNAILRNKK